MTLKQLLADGKLVKHRTSRQEIASLLKVVGRNVTDYDRAGEISEHEATELLQEVKIFKQEVADWLHNYYLKLAGS